MMPWMDALQSSGLIPYVATSELLIHHMDLSVFDEQEMHILLEEPAHRSFHEAWLVANAMAQGKAAAKLPTDVYVNCVLMQTAVIGFALPVDQLPETVLKVFESDPQVDLSRLEVVPVSGHVAGKAMDGSLVGYSLFSLRRYFPVGQLPSLAVPTLYAALQTYEADRCMRYLGITQYDNPALMAHARFGRAMEIEQAMLMMHSRESMSFVFSMDIEFDEARMFGPMNPAIDSTVTLMDTGDTAFKRTIEQRRKKGARTFIVDPVQVHGGQGLCVALHLED